MEYDPEMIKEQYNSMTENTTESNKTSSEDEFSASQMMEQYKRQQEIIAGIKEKIRLQEKGFEMTEYGYTFPGVDIDAINSRETAEA